MWVVNTLLGKPVCVCETFAVPEAGLLLCKVSLSILMLMKCETPNPDCPDAACFPIRDLQQNLMIGQSFIPRLSVMQCLVFGDQLHSGVSV